MNATQLSKKMTKLGRRGGKATYRKHGKRYFSKLAAKRKVCRGGRKPKPSDEQATPVAS